MSTPPPSEIVAADKAPAAAETEEHEAPPKPEKTADHARPQTFTTYNLAEFQDCLDDRDGARCRASFGDINALVDIFKADPKNGISTNSLPARREQFGMNECTPKKTATFLEFVLDALGDRVVQILIVAAIISIIFGMTLPDPHSGEVERSHGWIEGVAITISVFLVVTVGSVNNYVKAKQFEEMEKEQAIKKITAYRDGKTVTIDSNELVPGDVFEIVTGMEFPCDCVALRAQSLEVNESTLTGEIEPVEKDPHGDPFLLGGTLVEKGDGLAMVVAVGDDTFSGRLRRDEDEDKDTPLQEKLTELADLIGLFGFAGAVILVVALSLKEIILNSTRDGRTWTAIAFLNFILVAITLIAVAIPEGLPLAVTIALAFSMKAMMDDNCMVRVLASCETMGAANSVCSDKTGTLTTNVMTVVQGIVFGEEFVFEGCGMQPSDPNAFVVQRNSNTLDLDDDRRRDISEAILLNSTAQEVDKDGELIWKGDRTEIAMVTFVRDTLQTHYRDVRDAVPQEQKLSFPFSSERKQMLSLVRRDDSGVVTVYVKGASETVLAACKTAVNRDGSITELTADARAVYDKAILSMAKQSSRTIGVARATMKLSGPFPKEEPDQAEFELTLLGIIGIQDPIRPEVPAAVAKCHSAHLTVRMVTGDNIHTARAIAIGCHIMKDDGIDLAMTGPEFRTMAAENPEALMDLIPRLRVLARSSPKDKHLLVGLLQKRGEVVAVTGDGTNDAPALKLADVGFAMASGTDVAKSKAAMVLLDNNFASVVNAIKWGRAVNDNIKKFLQFQLSINVAGVMLTLIGSLVSETSKEPFTPVQLLWLNLIMDTLAALSLATERPEEQSLTRLPVYREAPLITRRMVCFIAVHGAFQFALIMAIMLDGHRWFKTVEDVKRCDFDNLASNSTVWGHCKKVCENAGGTFTNDRYCQQGTIHSTMIFNIFIWFQIFNVINSRKINGEMNPLEGVLTRSRNLIGIFALIAGLQACAVELTGDFMSVTGLTGNQWGICIGFGALELIVGVLQRFIPITDVIPEDVLEREAKDAELRNRASQTAAPF